ncbi:cytochrome P450 6k1 [Diachasma alloeum]|uniref:cytochrome P450 6k1 n=1 Tax=Diachasma alloeum TaxID=454923 RepID=UPI00073840C3|nr:cytochrome P450 6k1 [Diachasma alloeum]
MEWISSSSVVSVISVTLISLLPLFLLFWIYANYKLNYWSRRGVEQLPNTDLVFGNFKDAVLFRTAPGWHLGNLYRAARKDSPFVGFYIFHKPCLLLRDPEIIKQILIRDFENFSDRHFAGSQQKDSIGMKNLFGLKNPAWKYLRAKITPTLTRGKLKQMFPLMTEIGDNMMHYLKDQKIEEDRTRVVDAQELNYKFTTDLIASVALGTQMDSFNYPNEEFSKCVSEFFHGFKRMVALVTVFFMPELVEKIGSNILFDSKFVRKVFWNAVDEREKSGSKRGDFIDSLVQLKNGEQNPTYRFEGENLLYQSGTFFSGFESSSTTTSFTLMELAKNEQYQERARKDILRAIGEHGWGYEAINDMKYLDQCIAEGVRLHPPVSTIDRFTRDEYRIPGTDVVLESETPIYISLYGLQEDPKFFEDPGVFNPERFREGRQVSEAYIPFGLGPRMCVGMKVGQLHAKVVLSMILKEYEVYQSPEDKSYLDPRSTFTAAANGIILHFRKLET